MTKKNLRPQQVAPVKRETPANSSQGEKGIHPLIRGYDYGIDPLPFAGDDSE